MRLISDSFSSYQKLILKKEGEMELINTTINRNTNFSLTKKDFSFKKGIVIIKTTPKKKLEIFLKKDKIITELNKLGLLVTDLKL